MTAAHSKSAAHRELNILLVMGYCYLKTKLLNSTMRPRFSTLTTHGPVIYTQYIPTRTNSGQQRNFRAESTAKGIKQTLGFTIQVSTMTTFMICKRNKRERDSMIKHPLSKLNSNLQKCDVLGHSAHNTLQRALHSHPVCFTQPHSLLG